MIGANGNTRLDFCQYGNASNYKSITFDGTTLYLDGNCSYATTSGTSSSCSGNAATATSASSATNDSKGNKICDTYAIL